MNNPAIGDMACLACGGAATIHQQSRGKRYLYTKCSKCGVDQRNGAAVQSAIWSGATWRNGPPEAKPDNVADDWTPPAPAAPAGAAEPAAKAEPVKKSTGAAGGVLLSAGGLAALAAAVWLSGQRTKTTTTTAARPRALDERYY